MMPRPVTLPACTALALLLISKSAVAELSAVKVWEDWKAYMASTGYEVSASEASSGGTLTVTDMSMRMDLGDDTGDGRLDVQLDEVVFTEESDGSVTITLPEETALVVEMQPEEGEAVNVTIDYAQTNPNMVATGSEGDITYTYTADQATMLLSDINVDGVVLTQEIARFEVNMSDINYVTTNKVGDLRAITQDATAGGLSYDAFFENPESTEMFKMAGTMDGLTFKGAGDLPLDTDMQDASAMLSDGFAFEGTFESAGGSYELTFNGPDGGGTINSASEGGTIRVAMAQDGLNYEVTQAGVAMNMLLTEMPLPISFSARELATNFLMPLQKSDEEQDFAIGFSFSDFEMADALWGIFDAGGQLPRDPATIIIDLSGKAKVLFDFLDPAQAAVLETANAAPGELNALTLNQLELNAVGAKLTGAGDFTFDNGDLVTFDGLPRPLGALDLTLVGGNGLLDKLVGMGLVPEDQATGARLMMGLFAVPGDGEDTLNSRIEVNEEGHVLANGQRLR